MDCDPLPSVEEDGFGPRIITYQGPTCNYQSDCAQAGSSRSTCGLVALNCARVALKLEDVDQTALLQRMISQTTVNDMMAIVNLNDLKVERHLDVEELLAIPFFQETFTFKTRDDIQSVDALNDFFLNWFPDASGVHAAVFSNSTDVIACLKIHIFESHIYALFDSHTRPSHRNGPAFTFSFHLDEVAKYVNLILLQSSSVSADSLSQTHKFSAHILELKADAHKRDMHDMLARSAVYLSRRQMGADDVPSPLPFVESDHLSLLRLRAETLKKMRSQELSGAQPISSSLFSSETAIEPQHRGEFGWQLSLLLNPVSVSEDSDNHEDDHKQAVVSPLGSSHDADNKENIPPSSGFSRRSEYGWLTSFLQGYADHTEEQEDAKPAVPSKDDLAPQAGPSHSQHGEFGWQLALQKRTERARGVTSGTLGNSLKPALTDPLTDQQSVGNLPVEEPSTDNKDTWEAALLQQLQEEEEIAASSHHVSREHAWLVSLQKRLQEEENAKSNAAGSSSHSRSDLDWQLAVQLQQEVYRDEAFDTVHEESPRIVVESQDDLMDVDRPSLYAQSRSGNYLRVPTWRGSEDTSTFTTLDIPNQSSQSFECGICGEMHDAREKLTLSECDHSFCTDCLTTFTKTKIEEGRYPIFCPECLTQRNRTSKSHVEPHIIEKLNITPEELQRLEELQLVAHSITLECPRCKESMNVDREQYGEQSVIVCPLPRCGHKWCKCCLKTLASSEENHRCKNGNIDRLMRRKGWKYCPGCRTPVQKESGCNHMTCGAPGCNVHFCYRCGVLMIDTTNGGDVGTAVTEHYLNCRLFEKRLRCSIQ